MIVISCKNASDNDTSKENFEIVENNIYELHKPTKNIKAVLILFGGYPEKIADIKREFPILKSAKNNNIAVLYLNYNQKLWLEKSEKKKLVTQLQNIFESK